MTRTKTSIVGAAIELVAPVFVLTLLAFGLGFGVAVGDVNLTGILWPTSVMLLVGWNRTITGMATTLFSILINCVLYASVALLLRVMILWSNQVDRDSGTASRSHPQILPFRYRH